MAADFGPVGKASVEIGTALAPLRKGLEQARTMVRGAIKPMQVAVRVSQASIRAAQAAVGRLVASLKATLASVATNPLAILTAAAGGFGIAEALKGAVFSASDLAETISKASAVYGAASGKIVADAGEISKQFGINKKEFIDASVNLGRFGLAAGASQEQSARLGTQLARLGADLASFDNISTEDAFHKLQSGLAGESEPLRQHGVMLTEARMQEEALAAGLVKRGEALSESAKVMARVLVIQKDLSAASGDLERTSGGFANQYRMMTGKLQNMMASLGEALLPAATTITRAIGGVMEQIGAMVEQNKPAIQAWADSFAEGVRFVVGALSDLPTTFGWLAEETGHVGDMIGQVFANVAARVAEGFSWMGQQIGTVFGNVLEGVRSMAASVVATITAMASKIPALLSAMTSFDANGIGKAIAGLQADIAKGIAPDKLLGGFDLGKGTEAFRPKTAGVFGNMPEAPEPLKRARESMGRLRDQVAGPIRQAAAAAQPARAGIQQAMGGAKFDNGKPQVMAFQEYARKSITSGFLDKSNSDAAATAKNTERMAKLLEQLLNKNDRKADATAVLG